MRMMKRNDESPLSQGFSSSEDGRRGASKQGRIQKVSKSPKKYHQDQEQRFSAVMYPINFNAMKKKT